MLGKINNHSNWIQIDNLSEVNTQKIPPGLCWEALRSIKAHEKYPPGMTKPPDKSFIFTEVLLKHEDIHFQSYRDDYVLYYIDILYSWLNQWNKKCSDFDSLQAAQESALSHAKDMVKDYNNKKLFFLYHWDRGEAFNSEGENIIPPEIARNWQDIIEKRTHQNEAVQDLIRVYRKAIIDLCNN